MVSDSRPSALVETSVSTATRTPLAGDPLAFGTRVQDANTVHIRRMSWNGVIAGCITALALQLVLTMLGLGLGALAVDPMTQAEPQRGLGTGIIVWAILSGVISFGVGGLIAARTSGALTSADGALHGGLAWALAAVLGVVLTAATTSTVAGGGLAGIGQGIGALGSSMDRGLWPEGWSAYGRDPASPEAGRRGSENSDNSTSSRASREDTTGTGEAAARADQENRYPKTEAEARAAADQAAKTLGSSALWTCVAFLFGAGAACVGGSIGTKRPESHVRPVAA